MKTVTRIFALTLTVMPLLAAAQLSDSSRIITQVPFEFVVGNHTMPAGECIVQSASPGAKVLLIRNLGAKRALVVRALRDETKKASQTYALVFHHLGNKYFLAEMKVADSNTIYRMPQSKAEAELRARNLRPAEEILLASVR
jgi:hypothetical protein